MNPNLQINSEVDADVELEIDVEVPFAEEGIEVDAEAFLNGNPIEVFVPSDVIQFGVTLTPSPEEDPIIGGTP